MIKKFVYFIISTLFLFFSSSINPNMEMNEFLDKSQAIYSIHTNDDTESYSFIQLNKIEIFSKNIIRTGTPQQKVEIKPIVEKFIEYESFFSKTYEGEKYYSILTRYKTRILRI